MNENFNSIVSLLASNPWVVISSSLVGILGVILTFVFYFKSKRIKKLKTELKSINLLKNSIKKINGLNIDFFGAPIPNLTITKLALWSSGNESIHRSDIASSHQLSIEALNNSTFLEAEIIYTKNKHNLITINLSSDQKKILIDFEFLDFEEGAVIQILHTGSSSNDIEINGTIIGSGKIKTNSKKKYIFLNHLLMVSNKQYKSRSFGYIMMIAGAIASFFAIFMYYKKNFISPSLYEPISFLLAGLIYIITGYYLSRKKIPKGFEIFEESI